MKSMQVNGTETMTQERPEIKLTTLGPPNLAPFVNSPDTRQLENQEQLLNKVKREISTQIESIMTGSNEEFVSRCKILKQEMEARLRASEKFKELQIASLRNALHQEKLQAYNDLEVK